MPRRLAELLAAAALRAANRSPLPSTAGPRRGGIRGATQMLRRVARQRRRCAPQQIAREGEKLRRHVRSIAHSHAAC